MRFMKQWWAQWNPIWSLPKDMLETQQTWLEIWLSDETTELLVLTQSTIFGRNHILLIILKTPSRQWSTVVVASQMRTYYTECLYQRLRYMHHCIPNLLASLWIFKYLTWLAKVCIPTFVLKSGFAKQTYHVKRSQQTLTLMLKE